MGHGSFTRVASVTYLITFHGRLEIILILGITYSDALSRRVNKDQRV